MYKIQKLDDNQLENITGGMDCLASTGCFAFSFYIFSGAFSTLKMLLEDKNTEYEENDNNNDNNIIIENIPVNNIKYIKRDNRKIG